jgi:hypothetical protein
MNEPASSPHRRLRLGAAAGIAVVVLAAMAAVAIHLHANAATTPAGPAFQAEVSGVGFRCTLPITSVSGSARLTFPSGRVELTGPGRVPASAMNDELAFEQVTPAYDAPLRRWLPGVRPQWISPDGATYAEVVVTRGAAGQQGSSELRVVDVASGRRTVLWRGPGVAYLLGYGPGGIYFSTGSSTNPVQVPGSGGPEVWVVAADGGSSARKVGPAPTPLPLILPRGFDALGAGAAWATAVPLTPSGPAGLGPAVGPLPSLIIRMDLRSGAVTTFFRGQPGDDFELAGVSMRGEPVVFDSPATPTPPSGYFDSLPSVLLVTAEGTLVTISRPRDYFIPDALYVDTHGIWFGGLGSVWLYDPAGGIRQVAGIPTAALPYPAGVSPRIPQVLPSDYPFAGPSGQALLARLGPGILIAGPCT